MTSAPAQQRRVSPLSVAIGILAAIGFALLSAAGVYTDWLWFTQLGYAGVFTTQIIAQVLSFLAGFIVMSLIVGIALGVNPYDTEAGHDNPLLPAAMVVD